MQIFSREPDAVIVQAVRDAEQQYMDAQKALADHLAAISNIKVGSIIVHKDTKRRYRVRSFFGFVDGRDQPKLSLCCHLTYKNGRPDASDMSLLDGWAVGEIIPPVEAKGDAQEPSR